jgi:hypothetical protein
MGSAAFGIAGLKSPFHLGSPFPSCLDGVKQAAEFGRPINFIP